MDPQNHLFKKAEHILSGLGIDFNKDNATINVLIQRIGCIVKIQLSFLTHSRHGTGHETTVTRVLSAAEGKNIDPQILTAMTDEFQAQATQNKKHFYN